MLVVAISRSYGSAGSLFAHRLAERLGYDYADEAFIDGIGRDAEISEALRLSIDDEPSPTLLQRARDLMTRKSSFKLALSACIYDYALKHDIVLVGGGAHIILEHYPGMISIQVLRNMSDRIRDISADKKISYEEALKRIEEKDRAKKKFINYYFERELFDPLKFNITINASLVPLDDAIEMVVTYAKKHFSEVDREAAKRFLLKKQLEVKAELLFADPDVASDFGKVTFEAIDVGTLLVKGIVGGEEKKKQLFQTLWNLKGLKKVEDRLKFGALSRLLY